MVTLQLEGKGGDPADGGQRSAPRPPGPPQTLTGFCFGAGFLSAGFLAGSEIFLKVKGTPYLAAGLVIFWAGARGVAAEADRFAGQKHNRALESR